MNSQDYIAERNEIINKFEKEYNLICVFDSLSTVEFVDTVLQESANVPYWLIEKVILKDV